MNKKWFLLKSSTEFHPIELDELFPLKKNPDANNLCLTLKLHNIAHVVFLCIFHCCVRVLRSAFRHTTMFINNNEKSLTNLTMNDVVLYIERQNGTFQQIVGNSRDEKQKRNDGKFQHTLER